MFVLAALLEILFEEDGAAGICHEGAGGGQKDVAGAILHLYATPEIGGVPSHLYSVSETSSNRVNSTKEPLTETLEFANGSTARKRSAAGKFDGAVARFFQRVGLKVGLRMRVALQVGVPESKRGGIGVVEDGSALLGAPGQKRARRDEGHVVGAFDEEMVFVARLAAFERNFMPGGTRDWAEAVERAGHAHVRQRDSIAGMIVQTELAGPLW